MTRSTLGDALPRLLERAFGAGHRVVVKAPNPAEVARLNTLLWTYGEASFLPHGSAEDGREAEQPIYLTAGDEVPNGAGIGCQCGGAEFNEVGRFARVLDLFDGGDDLVVEAARTRWRRYKIEGHKLTYWQQNPNGGWAERKA